MKPEPYLKEFRVRCIPGFWFIGIGIELFSLGSDKDINLYYTNCAVKIGFLFFSVDFMFPVSRWKKRIL
jgi:hypothetical protein